MPPRAGSKFSVVVGSSLFFQHHKLFFALVLITHGVERDMFLCQIFKQVLTSFSMSEIGPVVESQLASIIEGRMCLFVIIGLFLWQLGKQRPLYR